MTHGERAAWWALAGVTLINLAARPLSTGLPGSGQTLTVSSVLGPVRAPAEDAAEIQAVHDLLAGAVPPGEPIFAPSWGAGWHLVSGRPNPTRFDITHIGIASLGADAAEVQAALRARPPAAVILPTWLWRPDTAAGLLQRRAAALRAGLTPWWDVLARGYTDRTPPGVTNWVVLVRGGA